MAQNVYDDTDFFAGYAQLARSLQGLDGAPEWPSMRAMLPGLRGGRVLDLDCGYGWFCRFALGQGAARVTGIDISKKMLARAAELTPGAGVEYRRADLETLSLPLESFDLVYSSLVLHYVVNLDALLKTVRRTLSPGGSLVFSVEHPIVTAHENAAWIKDEKGLPCWPVSRYHDHGSRSVSWIVDGVVKQHRTMEAYINRLIRFGFTLTRLEEWQPTDAQIAGCPGLTKERERPMFLLVSALLG